MTRSGESCKSECCSDFLPIKVILASPTTHNNHLIQRVLVTYTLTILHVLRVDVD